MFREELPSERGGNERPDETRLDPSRGEFSRSLRSYRFDREKVEEILRQLSEEERGKGRELTLDDIPKRYALGPALGLSGNEAVNQSSIAKRLIELGLLSADLPEGHSISFGTRVSRYLDSDIVGEDAAKQNLKSYVQQNFSLASEISEYSPGCHTLKRLLNVRGLSELRASIVNNGWLPDESTSAYRTVPSDFRHEGALRNPPKSIKNELSEISASLERDASREITFVKGEAFEQLVGILIGYRSPDEQLIPQYCLVVEEKNKYYGMRADWRIGQEIIEVKFGRAEQNIQETYEKHKEALLGGDLGYRMITLLPCALSGVPVTTFAEEIETLSDPAMKEAFRSVALLIQSFEDRDDQQSLRTLQLLRDALYTCNETFASVRGPERLKEVGQLLELIASTPESDLQSTLERLAPRRFNPLAAVFLHEGKLCRGNIELPAYHEENGNRSRFRLLYHFGGVRFRTQEDRDMAVYLEVYARKPVEGLLCEPERTQDQPVFILPGGRRLSRHSVKAAEFVENEDELLKKLDISQEWIDFIRDYIAYHGRFA